MSIKIDSSTLKYFEEKWSEKIKVFFYGAWCSWTKIDITDEFEISDELTFLPFESDIKIYVEKKDSEKFEDCTITRVVKADHTWKEKIRYIYKSWDVKWRCGCGSSFSFEEKKPKIDLEKLKNLKFNFNSWK